VEAKRSVNIDTTEERIFGERVYDKPPNYNELVAEESDLTDFVRLQTCAF
jgi:hypothetical protein